MNVLLREPNDNPISTYIALQGAAFFRTVLKLTDEDETDLAPSRDFYFANTNKFREAVANTTHRL